MGSSYALNIRGHMNCDRPLGIVDQITLKFIEHINAVTGINCIGRVHFSAIARLFVHGSLFIASHQYAEECAYAFHWKHQK